MKYQYLADNTEFLPTLAHWYFNEWGHIVAGNTIDKEIERLQTYLNKDKIPLILLAIENEELLGAAQLKYHEMTIYPDKTHWLGGVYVSAEHRGKGVARQLIQNIVEKAKNLNIKTLYLQTEELDGGLYRQLGWQPMKPVRYRGIDVLVMEKDII